MTLNAITHKRIHRSGYLTGGRDTLPYRVTYGLEVCPGCCALAVSSGIHAKVGNELSASNTMLGSLLSVCLFWSDCPLLALRIAGGASGTCVSLAFKGFRWLWCTFVSFPPGILIL